MPVFLHDMSWTKCFLVLFFGLITAGAFGQVSDSIPPVRDTARRIRVKHIVHKPVSRPLRADTIVTHRIAADTTTKTVIDTLTRRETVTAPVPPAKPVVIYPTDSFIYTRNPIFRFTDPLRFTQPVRKWNGMEGVFYALVVLLIFFAIIRNAFPKYLNDLFRLYFRATLKQRQIREQLVQAAAPSLLLNILFFISGGLYVTLLFQHFGWASSYGFWLLLVYAITALLLVYLVKFLVLKLCGWIFRVRDATDAYIFIVFTNNKIIGILLLAFDFFLAFTRGMTYEIAYSLSLIVVGGLFIYRFFVAYMTVQRQLKINIFHFLVYLAAFEIAPVLLINKLLLKYIIERP